MGYKRAGFDVVGCNEIDQRMMYAYCQITTPNFPILNRTMNLRCGMIYRLNYTTLIFWMVHPLFPLFSMAGSREECPGGSKEIS
jgi:DNA (cytosine-5)-methyltransferase 1